MTSFSFSIARPARFSLLVVPCPMNSQPRFFISSTALGWASQTCELSATRRLHARRIEHVGDPPEPDAHAVFAPGVVDDVRHAVRRIGRHAGADRRIVVPDLHVGRDPDGERLVAGPGERLALVDEGVLVAIGSPHRPERLSPGNRGQGGGQQARASGEGETPGDEIPAIVALHGAAPLCRCACLCGQRVVAAAHAIGMTARSGNCQDRLR